MALIHHNLLSIFAGVSKQDISLRKPNHCEEMINAYPTVQYGLKRRNPTVQLSNSVTVETDQFTHSYDRGLSGQSSEQYVITIDGVNGLRILDVIDGTYKTVTTSASALSYVESGDYAHGFSATTIQDTTFITNKDIITWQRSLLNQGYKNRYLDKVQALLRSILVFGVNYSYTSKNPFTIEILRNRDEVKREMLYWSNDEFNKFIAILPKGETIARRMRTARVWLAHARVPCVTEEMDI
jgi:hypothetical protein